MHQSSYRLTRFLQIVVKDTHTVKHHNDAAECFINADSIISDCSSQTVLAAVVSEQDKERKMA